MPEEKLNKHGFPEPTVTKMHRNTPDNRIAPSPYHVDEQMMKRMSDLSIVASTGAFIVDVNQWDDHGNPLTPEAEAQLVEAKEFIKERGDRKPLVEVSPAKDPKEF